MRMFLMNDDYSIYVLRRKMSELKKCPFCGNTNVFVGMDWELEDKDPDDGTEYFAVVCDYQNGGCGASGGYRETKEEAIAAWNNRESEVEHDA